MKIRGLQITAKQLAVSRIASGSFNCVVYVTAKDIKMAIDTNDGSWTITEDEIISFIKERNEKIAQMKKVYELWKSVCKEFTNKSNLWCIDMTAEIAGINYKAAEEAIKKGKQND